jgi:hypothetical protein
MTCCVCGGDLIRGPFGPGFGPDVTEAEREQRIAEALKRFLDKAGPATEDTLFYWIKVCERLALDVGPAHMLESGELEVVGLGNNGDPLLALRTRPA